MPTPGRILTEDHEIATLLRGASRIAVLGIKTEAQAAQPAFYVPAYLAAQGLEVVPVPVYYPEVAEILGRKVFRAVSAIPGEVDIVDVFRRPEDLSAHLDDLLAKKPRAVWLQSGIRHDDIAARLTAASIDVVQDRCIMVEHRRRAR